jgi:anti-sigma factor RsiW
VSDHELVALYALDALDADETAAFEEHLAGCAECRSELDSLRATAASLAFAVEGPAPPRALGEVIVERARRERQENVFALGPRRALRALAAVAVAAALVLAVWAASLHRTLVHERSAHDRLVRLLAAPDARKVALAGADGSLVVARDGQAALVFRSLPPAGSGKTYEAWVVEGSTPKPAGTFSGSTVLLSRRVPPGATVAVTRERSGGAEKPTLPILYHARAT